MGFNGATVPVVGGPPNYISIKAAGWDAMTSTGDTIDNSLYAAKATNSPTYYWTGSLSNGVASSQNCLLWTTPNTPNRGQVGDSDVTTAGGYMSAISELCNAPNIEFMCVCYWNGGN